MDINILIVDDDKILVKKLEETVNWDAIGISMVFSANDIHQASAILSEFQIHLLLCDIDMPQGSGLELLEWVRARRMNIDCIFLSSYANFAYAQKALELSSREYLLKPISNEALEKTLKRVVKDIVLNQSGTVKKENFEVLQFWSEYLSQTDTDDHLSGAVYEKISYNKTDKFSFIIIRYYFQASSESVKKERMHFEYVIKTSIPEFFMKQSISPEAIVASGDFECHIVLKETGDLSENLREIAKDFSVLLKNAFSSYCCIYVGDFSDMEHLWLEKEKLEHVVRRAVPDDQRVIFVGDWCGDNAYVDPPWETWKKGLSVCGDVMDIQNRILDWLKQIGESRSWTTEYLSRFIRELVQMLYYYLNDFSISFGRLFDTEEFDRMEQYAHFTMDGARKFVCYIFEKIEGSRRSSNNRSENIIEQIKSYIEMHLKEELSRKMLAGSVYLSEVYVSKLFAQVTGVSIPAYITSRRIEKAKDYLRNSSLPVSKIAIEVGYSNFSYFSKTFKDMTGYTPNEYRNRTKV